MFCKKISQRHHICFGKFVPKFLLCKTFPKIHFMHSGNVILQILFQFFFSEMLFWKWPFHHHPYTPPAEKKNGKGDNVVKKEEKIWKQKLFWKALFGTYFMCSKNLFLKRILHCFSGKLILEDIICIMKSLFWKFLFIMFFPKYISFISEI